MKVSVLFSGGKDSCLTAIMLSKLFEVELVTCVFGILQNWKQAETVAKKLGLPFKRLKLKKEVLDKAINQILIDGFPNNGIKYIHQKALENTAVISRLVADGVRRDDMVPVLSLAEIRRLEDKFNVHYIQPLMGYSRKTINILEKEFFEIKEYKSSSSFIGAEYEFELREIIKRKYGIQKIKEIFPQEHTHSIVIKMCSQNGSRII